MLTYNVKNLLKDENIEKTLILFLPIFNKDLMVPQDPGYDYNCIKIVLTIPLLYMVWSFICSMWDDII